jgi:hypothetical protein
MADENNLLQEYGGKIVSGFFMLAGTVLVGVSKWLVGREVARIDSKFASLDKDVDDLESHHSARIRTLEMNVATKEDLHEIRTTMTTQHGQLMEAILSTRRE